MSHTGYRERTFRLLCSREVWFTLLPPGDYLLTLQLPRGRQDLWLHLSPGSHIECRVSPDATQWCWNRFPCHCTYDLT